MVQVITADYSNLNLRGIHADFWRGFPDVTGKRVFIKPNLVCPATNYDYWSTTRVEVVEMVIKKIKRGNPSEIIIGECGFKGQWQNTIKSTGYDRLADIPGVRLVALQDGENYHKFTLQRLPEGMYRSLFGVKFSDYLLESDVVINIPKMKVHTMAGITGSIKNMMGTMAQKGNMHPRGSIEILHKRLADLYSLTRKMVHFIVMDGITGCEYAEQSGVPIDSGVLISGTDQWEVDVAAARLMGVKPHLIEYLRYIRRDWESVAVPEELVKQYEMPLNYRK